MHAPPVDEHGAAVDLDEVAAARRALGREVEQPGAPRRAPTRLLLRRRLLGRICVARLARAGARFRATFKPARNSI
jgi:hypothetical protein